MVILTLKWLWVYPIIRLRLTNTKMLLKIGHSFTNDCANKKYILIEKMTQKDTKFLFPNKPHYLKCIK